MQIDPDLKAKSIKFAVESFDTPGDELLRFGHFSAYEGEFGLAWMQTAGIDSYFNHENLFTFITDNHDNYQYNNVLSKLNDREQIRSFVSHFNLPLDTMAIPENAWVGYLYASHDEYCMIFFQDTDAPVTGYVSNGFDIYEIIPVFSPDTNPEKRLGYQFRLHDDFVGSIQTSENQTFRMSNEYCDATEMVVATLASSILRCNQL